MALKFRVRPENSVNNIPVPFETERQREILIPNKDKLTLEDLYNKSRDIQSKCQDASVILTTPDTVHYDSDRDEFSFVTDEGVFHTLVTDHSKSQMCNRLGIPVRFLQRLQGAGLHELASENINTLFTTGDMKPLFLRMYTDSDRRYLRGMLTPSYSPMDTDVVLDSVMESVSGTDIENYKVKSFTLTPERFHTRLTGPKLNIPGEDLYSGIQIDSSDVGKSSLSVKYLIYKLVCKNGLMVAKKDFTLFGRVHKGMSPLEFRDKFVSSIERLPELVAVAEHLITSTMTKGETYDFDNMEEDVMTHFIKSVKHKTALSDKSMDKVIELMQTRYTPTRWGLINSITEVAQDFTLSRRLELEKIAGDMLLVA